MIEAKLEAATIAAIKNQGFQTAHFAGAWQPNADGEVKGQETPGTSLHLGVAASLREFETFTSPRASVRIAWTALSRLDWDADGKAFRAAVARIVSMLHHWQISLPAVKEVFAVVDADGGETFTPHGLRMEGGLPSKTEAAWVASGAFTLRGIISQFEPAQLPSS